MTIGPVLSSAWAILRRRPGAIAGIVAVPVAVQLLVSLTTGWGSAQVPGRGALGGLAATTAILALAQIFAFALATGLTLRILSQDPDARVGALLPQALSVTGWLAIPALVLAAVAFAVAVGVMGLLIGGLWATADGAPTPTGGSVLLAILATPTLVAVGLFLASRFAHLIPVMMHERLALLPALRRAWALTRGSAWHTLGSLLVIGVVTTVAARILGLPLGSLGRDLAEAAMIGYQAIAITVLYVDQVRRQSLAAQRRLPWTSAPAGSAPGAPAGPAPGAPVGPLS